LNGLSNGVFKMNTLKQAIANTAYVKTMALAGALLASTMVSAQPSDESNLAPFSAASIGMMKNTDTEQAAEQEQQALSLLQQWAPAQNVEHLIITYPQYFNPPGVQSDYPVIKASYTHILHFGFL